MRIVTILLGALLGCLAASASCANSTLDTPKAIKKKDVQMKHGKDGKNGLNGENGQDGEDGQNGGDGGNGGNGGPGFVRGGNGGNGGDGGCEEDLSTNIGSMEKCGQVDEWEYTILKDACRQIVAITVSKFYDPSDSLCLATYKQGISTYLLEVGTPAADKILQEYENVKWNYPDITSI